MSDADRIRVRVISELFHDVTPKAPPKAPVAAAAAGPGQPVVEAAPVVTGPPPYRIEVSLLACHVTRVTFRFYDSPEAS